MDVIAAREAYRIEQPEMPTDRLVFVDESGVRVSMNRLYGWSTKGKPAVVIRDSFGKKLNIVGGISASGPRGCMLYEGSMNADVFVRFVTEHLGPTLRPGDIVVLDGLRVHRTVKVRGAIEACGAKVLILPPYSPELNPIEHTWSTLKARLRALGPVTWDRLGHITQELWDKLDETFFPAWIKTCGYAVST